MVNNLQYNKADMVTPKEKIASLSNIVVASSTRGESLDQLLNALEISDKKIVHIHLRLPGRTIKFIKQFIPACRADGAIISDSKFFLKMTTADCIPLILVEPDKKIGALIHVGWRNVVFRLPRRAALLMKKKFNIDPANLLAYCGPSIQAAQYRHQPSRALKKKILFFVSGNRQAVIANTDGTISFDLPAATTRQLLAAGLQSENIERSAYCTARDRDLFPSHFRQGAERTESVITVFGFR